MDESTFYHWLVIAWMALAAVTFVALFFVTAPYGRFTRGGWGPRMSARWGWILMETPVLITFLVLYGAQRPEVEPREPGAARVLGRPLPPPLASSTRSACTAAGPASRVSVIAMGACFNVGNGYLNGRYLFALGPELQTSWLLDPRFIVGALLFWFGYVLNQHSDRVLIGLRADGETGYKIPHGGGYRFVSCPNYLGEMVEWGGWALACWNLGALAFFVWTVANLAPRAIKTHRWYRDEFPDYPPRAQGPAALHRVTRAGRRWPVSAAAR